MADDITLPFSLAGRHDECGSEFAIFSVSFTSRRDRRCGGSPQDVADYAGMDAGDRAVFANARYAPPLQTVFIRTVSYIFCQRTISH